MWQKVWRGKRKKEKPNKMRDKPTIAFRSNLAPEILGYIKRLAAGKDKSEFINRAVGMRYFYLTSRRKFVEEVIKDNFQLAKHLLRKEGSRRNNVKNH